MNGIQLKIAGQWIALPQDFSLSMEQSSPLFNEQGTFSFPFEVPLAPNRHVFKNLADPFGRITLRDINGLDAELWYDGIMLYRGKTETEEETEIEDVIPLTFISGNSDFMTRIEGMKAREVPLDREIKIGVMCKDVMLENVPINDLLENGNSRFELPEIAAKQENINISDPYPFPYCNVRVCCTKMTEKIGSDGKGTGEYVNDGYKILEADRPFSGVCFYVLYFLEVLFKYIGITYDKTSLMHVEDMNRLAFWVTRCKYKLSEEEVEMTHQEAQVQIPGFYFIYKDIYGHIWSGGELEKFMHFYRKDMFATNENFPDIDVEGIITALRNAFGVRFIYDDASNRMKAVYLRDIFRNTEVISSHAEILNMIPTKYYPKGYKVTYGNKDDDNFNYTDYSKVDYSKNYIDIIHKRVDKYDTTCYQDENTGNSYRVTVDEENGEYPIMFEVGGFNPYTTNGAADDAEEVAIPFTPVVLNDVNFQNEKRAQANSEDYQKQILAPFADVELRDTDLIEEKVYYGYSPFVDTDKGFLKFSTQEAFDIKNEEVSPLREYDTGFTLGVMRGPGTNASLDVLKDNYDGEGNDWWAYTSGNYAFTSDSIDNYGRHFDYNGTEEGGIDQSGRFSLKLIAEKPGQPISQEHKDRGLVAKFLSEYLYFMANKKTLTLTVDMSISDIIHVDFLKRYKIGEYVGFINKISYSLDMDRVRNIQVEMFTL